MGFVGRFASWLFPFWGRCTTHFRSYFISGDWDVHWGYGLSHGQLFGCGMCCETGSESKLTYSESRILLRGSIRLPSHSHGLLLAQHN